jgi:hypothetical protein
MPFDEVGECTLTVDLEHRQVFAVTGFEVRISIDGYHLQLEPDVFLDLSYDLESPRAEAAPLGRIEHDPSYG